MWGGKHTRTHHITHYITHHITREGGIFLLSPVNIPPTVFDKTIKQSTFDVRRFISTSEATLSREGYEDTDDKTKLGFVVVEKGEPTPTPRHACDVYSATRVLRRHVRQRHVHGDTDEGRTLYVLCPSIHGWKRQAV